MVERQFPDAPAAKLKELGYVLVPRGGIGNVHAIELDEGKAVGVSDPRGIGKPAYE